MSVTDIPPVRQAAPDPGAVAEEFRFPCHTCGAELSYSPGTDTLVCGHCGAVEPIAGAGRGDRAGRELDYDTAAANALPVADLAETRTTRCTNCGAEVEFHGAEHASRCPFCASPVVIDTGTQRRIKPRGLLPFALTERAARAAMTDWIGGLWFAPGGLKDYARSGRALDGVYVPYWTFDAQTETDYRGQRGDVYYTTRTIRENGRTRTIRERHVRWSRRSGHVSRFFDDVLVLASHALPRRYTDELEPWDLEALQDYRPEYLAGFSAEAYTVGLTDGMTEARRTIDKGIRAAVETDIGGDEQRIDELRTTLSNVTFKHILLPIWLAAYKYNGRSFRLVVNARTGEVQGERPYSAWKIAFAVLVGLVVVGVFAWLTGQNQ